MEKRIRPSPHWFVLIALLIGGVGFCAAAQADKLTPGERRGRQIYIQTTSPTGGEIKALVGKSMMEAPGASLPCINCHGYDGVGLVESGVTATTIIWEELTKPYGIKHTTGREHPPYTEETLARAISDGVDPAGNPLDVSMPRYKMSQEDLADLVAYIKRLGTLLDPGLTETSITLGAFLPTEGRLAGIGKAMESVLRAFFSDINKGGGVYNRRIELHLEDAGENATSTIQAARRLIEKEEVFALVSPFIAGADRELALLAEEKEVPVFGPFTLQPEDVSLLNRFTFYLYSGLREQVRALLIHGREKLQSSQIPIAFVYSTKETPTDVLQVAEKQAKKLGWKSVEKVEYSGGSSEAQLLASTMKQRNVGAVLFLGPWDNLKILLNEVGRVDWNPLILLPGSTAKSDLFDLPAVFSNRITVSYPHVPDDQTGAGAREFNRFQVDHGLPRDHLAAQISAYCAGKIFVEGLKRTGRKLSREKLVKAMEGITEFETGLTPRITYDPNRRIGAYGAHVMGVDIQKKTFSPDGRWIALDLL